MASNVGQPGMWLPPTAKAKTTPRAARPGTFNPFQALQKKLNSMGFNCKYRHDEKERVIEVLFEPLNDKTRQAVKVAAQSSQATGLKTLVTYGVLDDPVQAMCACIEKGLEELRQAL